MALRNVFPSIVTQNITTKFLELSPFPFKYSQTLLKSLLLENSPPLLELAESLSIKSEKSSISSETEDEPGSPGIEKIGNVKENGLPSHYQYEHNDLVCIVQQAEDSDENRSLEDSAPQLEPAVPQLPKITDKSSLSSATEATPTRRRKAKIRRARRIGFYSYKCRVCHLGFTKKASLVSHQKWICGKDPQFPCTFCDYKAKRKDALFTHNKHKHSDMMYTVKKAEDSHDYQSSDDLPPQLELNVPMSPIPTKKSLPPPVDEGRSLSLQRTKRIVHRCENCNKTFTSVSTLLNHQTWICGKDPQFHCTFCNYKGRRKDALFTHIRRRHRNIKKQGEDFSENQFLDDSPPQLQLAAPLSPHPTKKPLLSSATEVTSPNLSIASRTRRSSSTGRHRCEICQKTFETSDSLVEHQTWICEKDPQYACTFCDYKTERKDTLATHNQYKHMGMTHVQEQDEDFDEFESLDDSPPQLQLAAPQSPTPTKKFPLTSLTGETSLNLNVTQPRRARKDSRRRCEACRQTFSTLRSLSRHQMWICGKEPQFECTFCDYKAKRKDAVFAHIKKKHENDREVNDHHDSELNID